MLDDGGFIGGDSLTQDRTAESLAQLDPERVVRVMRLSFVNGADGFLFYTHPANLAVFKLLSSRDPEASFDLYPLFPYAPELLRVADEKGTVGMVMERVKGLAMAGRVRSLFKGGLAALGADPYGILKVSLDAEVESFVRAAPRRARLSGIFLHDLIVDLSVALGLREIIMTHISRVAEGYGVRPGLVTKNFPRLVRFLEKNDFPLRELTILTPFNKLGFQMNPSKEACEEMLASRDDLDVVATNILSAGILDFETALDYIKKVKNLTSVVVGVSKEEQAKATFRTLTSLKRMMPRALSMP